MSVEAAKGVGVLRVHLKRGAGLKAADLNGFSDPYVKVLSGGQQKKTKIIKKTLNPEWNEAVDLAGSFDDFVKSGLLLKVMDWDRVGFDDPLGDLPVQLDWLHTQSHRDFAERLPTKGVVHFGVTWLPTGERSWAREGDDESADQPGDLVSSRRPIAARWAGGGGSSSVRLSTSRLSSSRSPRLSTSQLSTSQMLSNSRASTHGPGASSRCSLRDPLQHVVPTRPHGEI